MQFETILAEPTVVGGFKGAIWDNDELSSSMAYWKGISLGATDNDEKYDL